MGDNEPTCDYGGDEPGSYCGSVDLVELSANRRETRRLCSRHLAIVAWDWLAQGETSVTVRPLPDA